MKDIIHRITQQIGLEYLSLDKNLDFAYYEEKDDFFLLLFYNYQDLMKVTNDHLQDLEYALNTIVVNTKKSEELLQLNERNINYNLSLILFVALDDENPELLQEFNKVEENYINAKKYILPYQANALEQLKSKMGENGNIIQVLNNLAMSHSDDIQNVDKKWYDLLLNLFIKIPFLNYQSTDHTLAITSLANSIDEILTEREAFLLSNLKDENIAIIGDIESFARQKKMIE